MKVFNTEKREVEKRMLVDIARDSNGVYIAIDIALQMYFWNDAYEVWVPIQCFDEARKEDA